jgi:hypothetical protein
MRTSGGVRRELWTVQWSTTASRARRRFGSSGWGTSSRRVMVPTRADAGGIVLAEIEISHRSVETFGR